MNTNDIRVLNRERILRDKDTPAGCENRRGRRELKRLLESQKKMLEVGAKYAPGVKREPERENGCLAGEIGGARSFVAAGRAGLLTSVMLAAGILAAGCGSVIPMDDADTSEESDVPEEVQPDEGFSPDTQEDAAVPEDDGGVEADEGSPDVGDEGSIDEDAGDSHGAEGDGDLHDGVDDAGHDETDVPACEPVVYTETHPPEPAGTICGISRQKIVTLRITEYGAGCPRPERETSLESVVYRITRPLDLANLICARGNETELLNPGTYLIVDLIADPSGSSVAEIRVGQKVASMLNMRVDDILNGGVYRLQVRDIGGTTTALNRLLDSTGAYIRDIIIPAQNSSPMRLAAIDPNYGGFAWDQVDILRTSQGIIRLNGGLPIVLVHLGTHDYEVPGDEGRFIVRINIDGAGSDDSYGFFRDRSK